MRISDWSSDVCSSDLEGTAILDGRAGLWCVNIGYGRAELAEVAARQMRELPYYNTFFKTTTRPAAELAARLAELTPAGLEHAFFASSGSEANDTIVRMVRRYWQILGQPERSVIIRSEEHTSELQSLMRISYAVFCLKKKNVHLHLISSTIILLLNHV